MVAPALSGTCKSILWQVSNLYSDKRNVFSLGMSWLSKFKRSSLHCLWNIECHACVGGGTNLREDIANLQEVQGVDVVVCILLGENHQIKIFLLGRLLSTTRDFYGCPVIQSEFTLEGNQVLA